ncbi:protein PHYTOCHROME KINASE SUBSTRATE 2-like [Curcuma longa]|uniref:protein PHYTOCHROME KINASE SUBSTRATE 2-like n=1 Tax=Curcuma longa TaxID=136217 RepID=UPI003D9E2AE6
MASVKVTPKTLFAFEPCSCNPRDSSSSYLAFVRENSFPPELGDNSTNQLSCQIGFNRRRSTAPDGEIEIFDAEKYFSGVMDGDASEPSCVPTPTATAKKKVRRQPRSVSRPGSSTSGTSCNSRSTLLPDRNRGKQGHLVVDGGRRDAAGKKFLGVFPCSCARKHAINIDKEAQLAPVRPQDEHLVCESRLKRISPGLRRYDPFPLPPINLNSKFKPEEKVVIGGVQNVNFGVNFTPKGDLAIAQKRSSFTALTAGEGGRDEDVLSEASSDLFEIESISMSSHPFFTIEGSESATATTGYEPSEASVEWSVVTASVANFSMSSDSVEQGASSLRKTRRSSGSGLLLGCVSEKAVDVTAASGGSGTRTSARGSVVRRECVELEGAVTPTARYRVESCGVDLSSGRAGRVLPQSPFGSSRSTQD